MKIQGQILEGLSLSFSLSLSLSLSLTHLLTHFSLSLSFKTKMSMSRFNGKLLKREFEGDTRFAVLPGVLHTNAVWGNGTTGTLLNE